MPHARLPVFEKFIGDLRAVWSAETDDARRMDKARPLVEAFVKDPDLKAHSAQWPSTEGRKNLLLYVDPAYDFVVNAVVRVPGRTGSVHDHANAWVLYGVLDGTERLERYDRVDGGSRPGHAEVRLTSVTTGTQGKVDLVPPHAMPAHVPFAGELATTPEARDVLGILMRRTCSAAPLLHPGRFRPPALPPYDKRSMRP